MSGFFLVFLTLQVIKTSYKNDMKLKWLSTDRNLFLKYYHSQRNAHTSTLTKSVTVFKWYTDLQAFNTSKHSDLAIC